MKPDRPSTPRCQVQRGLFRSWRGAALALLLLFAAACFERPVDEELEIRFLAEGGLVTSSSVRIGKAEDGNTAMEERLARARHDLEAGDDFWDRQLGAIRPASERLVQDRTAGILTRAVHRVYLKRPGDLRALLVRAAGSVRLASGDGWSELTLGPLPGSRAGESERRRSAELLEEWSERVSRHIERTRDLYRYLEARPQRASSCLAPLFENAGEIGASGIPAPTDEETALIDPVQDSMREVIEMFEARGGAAWTSDEIVRLANDPFPSRIVVLVPGRVLESEGFVVEKGGRLALPEGGLFGAIAALEGAWVQPDPLVAYVRHARSDASGPFDLESFLARPRTARSGATPAGVRRALEKALAPSASYRVRWAAPGATALEEEGPDALDWDTLAP